MGSLFGLPLPLPLLAESPVPASPGASTQCEPGSR